MVRKDQKYVVEQDKLPKLYKFLMNSYALLEVDGEIHNSYETDYYDTKDFDLYHMHHNKRRSRFKLRERTYVKSSTKFIEFKEKNNKSVTHKTRSELNSDLTKGQLDDLVDAKYPIDYTTVDKVVKVSYERLTFVGDQTRITVDQGLTFSNGENRHSLNKTAIVEFKYTNNTQLRAFHRFMLSLGIRPMSVSKYCIGMTYLYDLKSNNFKRKLRAISKIEKNELV